MDVSENRLNGSVDLTRLPESLLYLNLNSNAFSACQMENRLYVAGKISTPFN